MDAQTQQPSAPTGRMPLAAIGTWPARLGLAVAGGCALRGVLNLDPTWWLAWLAPVPVLVAVTRAGRREATVLATLAGIVATSVNLDYLRSVMDWTEALGVVLLQALAWTLVLGLSARAMRRGGSAAALLMYPLAWTAFDTVSAHVLRDGNWGSLGYSQAGFLPAVQITALGGVALLVFVMSLLPAALAMWVLRGRAAWPGVVLALVLAGASLAYGVARLDAPTKPGMQVGLAAIDEPIGPQAASGYANAIWDRYETLVAGLATRGARVVVLPEKIAVFGPGRDSAPVQARLARAAAANRVWIVAGVGTEDNAGKHNLAWVFAPSGALVDAYAKQHFAPRERGYVAGQTLALQFVDQAALGVAICKDVHFAHLGRDYATRGATVMAVPAWDFRRDGPYAARLSALRGVESGLAMVRVARDGVLAVTDGYGRVVARAASAPMPGVAMLARVPAQAAGPTLYARSGDVFGWSALAATMALYLRVRRKARAQA